MLVKNLNETAELIRSSHTTFLGPKIADKSYLDGYQTFVEKYGIPDLGHPGTVKAGIGKGNAHTDMGK